MTEHRIVSHDEWIRQRNDFLVKEKELTRAREALAKARRELPWESVDENYVFEGSRGEVTLSESFDGRSQLVVYHFMYGPKMTVGCKSCSFWADSFERNVVHLAHRDVTMVVVSRGPLEKLLAFQKRLGWTFEWVSSARSDFNFDYHVSFDGDRNEHVYNYEQNVEDGSEWPGFSVFFKDEDGAVYHTYSCFSRGIDAMNATYQILDLTPKGRDEGTGFPMHWVRHRDNYDAER